MLYLADGMALQMRICAGMHVTAAVGCKARPAVELLPAACTQGCCDGGVQQNCNIRSESGFWFWWLPFG
jgi:hypothetical protein